MVVGVVPLDKNPLVPETHFWALISWTLWGCFLCPVAAGGGDALREVLKLSLKCLSLLLVFHTWHAKKDCLWWEVAFPFFLPSLSQKDSWAVLPSSPQYLKCTILFKRLPGASRSREVHALNRKMNRIFQMTRSWQMPDYAIFFGVTLKCTCVGANNLI